MDLVLGNYQNVLTLIVYHYPNKNQSIKIEFREKVNTDDNRITYSKSDYLNYKKYFTEIAFVSE